MIEALIITPEMRAALARLRDALQRYPNETHGYTPIERAKVELADATVQALADQARIGKLPTSARGGMVEIRVSPARRKKTS